jgi:hypothetical protein
LNTRVIEQIDSRRSYQSPSFSLIFVDLLFVLRGLKLGGGRAVLEPKRVQAAIHMTVVFQRQQIGFVNGWSAGMGLII